MDKTTRTPNPKSTVTTETSWLEWFTDDFYPQYEKQVWVAAGVVVVAALIYFGWVSQSQRSSVAANKALGEAYVALAQDKFLDAEKALTGFLHEGYSGLARDKAYLYLGKTYYDEQKYDQALDAYDKVKKDGKSTELIYSGALHGEAACFMQNKNYALAAQTLEELLNVAMRRTGNPKEDLAGSEVVDLSPSIPNALWKLALCYRELKQPDKVKATVEKLRKAYPGSTEAQNGAKLLALID